MHYHRKNLVKGVFCSDFHWGYPGSRLKDGIPLPVWRQLAKYDLIVFGGDVVDLHYLYHLNLWKALRNKMETGEIPGRGWSFEKICESFLDLCKNHDYRPTVKKEHGGVKVEPALKACIDEAVDKTLVHISRLCRQLRVLNPKAKLLILIGNHDNYKRFDEGLKRLCKKHPNFLYNPEYFCIGDGLYTHSDLPLRGQDMETREILRLKSYMQHWVSMEIESMVHNPVRENWFRYWNHAGFVVPRLAEGLKSQENLKIHLEDINRVFFGHIHADPFFDYYYDGKFYTQTGSTVRRGSCVPAEFILNVSSCHPVITGDERNLLYAGETIESVKGLEITGLTHRQPPNFVTRVLDSRFDGKDYVPFRS